MSHKQDRIINEQQYGLKKAHLALEQLRESHERLKEAANTAVRQIETGFGHCAANKLRTVLNDINNSEAPNDSAN